MLRRIHTLLLGNLITNKQLSLVTFLIQFILLFVRLKFKLAKIKGKDELIKKRLFFSVSPSCYHYPVNSTTSLMARFSRLVVGVLYGCHQFIIRSIIFIFLAGDLLNGVTLEPLIVLTLALVETAYKKPDFVTFYQSIFSSL